MGVYMEEANIRKLRVATKGGEEETVGEEQMRVGVSIRIDIMMSLYLAL